MILSGFGNILSAHKTFKDFLHSVGIATENGLPFDISNA
jgi:hypothetical protein